jgi:short subunit dehydrogenase-like uncharacterized protein
MSFLLYGANGYTAQLTIELALQEGLKPILAGRNELKIKALAEQYGLPYRVFDLAKAEEIVPHLKGVQVVLHCAGPFMFTAAAMMDACIMAGVHYLDITGETDVFEMGAARHQKAVDAGVMLMSGVGFDVVPTDCMAVHLHEQMPDATHLSLAFAMRGGGLSHGTASTAIQKMGTGGLARKNGVLEKVATVHDTRNIDFGEKTLSAGTIPWGDLVTAFHSTKIPNIVVYLAMSPKMLQTMRLQNYFQWFFKRSFVRNILQKRIDAGAAGPTEAKRNAAVSFIWGEVRNAKGDTIEKRFKCAEGYNLTAAMSLHILKKVLQNNFKTGYQTPAACYGSGLIFEDSRTEWL